MKKTTVLLFIGIAALQSKAQTRNNAGLQGDQGATSGYFETYQPVNYPSGASSWWFLLDVRHSNVTNNHAMQFSGSFFDQDLYFRKTNNNAAQTWSKVLTETNGHLNGKIDIYTPIGQNFFTGHQMGSGYSYQSGIFHAIADNPNGNSNIYYDGVTDGVSKFSVRADGQGYFGGNVGIGTTNPAAQLHLYKNSPYSSDNDVALLTLQNDASTQGYAEIRAISNLSDFRVGTGGSGTSPAGSFSGAGYVNMVNDNPLLLATNNTVRLFISSNAVNAGNVGIGTTNPTEKLAVNGSIRAKEIKVEASPWPDYVFNPGHHLPELSEIEKYIQKNSHLPEIPSAAEVQKEGINLGEMNVKLLQKIEELTLYIIQQEKRIRALESKK